FSILFPPRVSLPPTSTTLPAARASSCLRNSTLLLQKLKDDPWLSPLQMTSLQERAPRWKP
ncbi:hypothetical protein QQS21_011652, partial [Conoideocrella luteorostrata]